MKRFVVVGNGRENHQFPIGSRVIQVECPSSGGVLWVRDTHGTEQAVPLSDLRELDDSPIAAGDEVVCVDASDRTAITVGASYFPTFVTSGALYFSASGYDRDRFVKVKPLSLPQPEVKQEAVDHSSYFVRTKMKDGVTVEQWFPTHTAACDHAKEMCRNGTAKNARVCKTVTLVEPQEPKMTSF